MQRRIRLLVLAGSFAIGAGCDGGADTAPTAAYYDTEVVERLAPGCLEAGYEAVVCGCTLHKLSDAMRSPEYFLLEIPGRAERGWPGEEGGALARWHASCEMWAAALGLTTPQVATGPRD